MENSGSKRRRIVLPLSRVILILVVGGVFLLRGIVAAIDKASGKPAIGTALLLVYILIGMLMLVGGVVALLLRWRARKDN